MGIVGAVLMLIQLGARGDARVGHSSLHLAFGVQLPLPRLDSIYVVLCYAINK